MPEFSFPLLFSPVRRAAARRLILGLHINPDETQIQAAVVEFNTKAQIIAVKTTPLPFELASLWRQWSDFTSSEEADRNFPASVSIMRLAYTELLVQLAECILKENGLSRSDILLVGVLDPGLWFTSRGKTVTMSCFESAILAQKTGLNICDGFAQSDLACGGQGGPIAAAALWTLLKSPDKNRLLLELNNSAVKITFIPPELRGGLKSVLAFDAAPGIDLINELTRRISYNAQPDDSAGRLAVQGKSIPELMVCWKNNAWRKTPPPRWNPAGVRAGRFLIQTLNSAVEKKWNLPDILCTATLFIANCISDAVQKHLPGKIEQVYLAGQGKTNGFLLREIRRRIPHVECELQAPTIAAEEALYPASAAVLGNMFINRTAGNLPQVTGCKSTQPLGRITPGDSESYQRLIDVLTQAVNKKAASGNAA